MIPIKDRFWFLVDVQNADACWPWLGAINNNGYGQHRRAYELVKGPIPEGLVVMHLCNNRACCNPNHLEVGTQSDNLMYSRLCLPEQDAKRSLSCRAALKGKGIQYDKRSDTYSIMFKVLGRPLYIGMEKNRDKALMLAKAAMEDANKLLRTVRNITYEEVKAHYA